MATDEPTSEEEEQGLSKEAQEALEIGQSMNLTQLAYEEISEKLVEMYESSFLPDKALMLEFSNLSTKLNGLKTAYHIALHKIKNWDEHKEVSELIEDGSTGEESSDDDSEDEDW